VGCCCPHLSALGRGGHCVSTHARRARRGTRRSSDLHMFPIRTNRLERDENVERLRSGPRTPAAQYPDLRCVPDGRMHHHVQRGYVRVAPPTRGRSAAGLTRYPDAVSERADSPAYNSARSTSLGRSSVRRGHCLSMNLTSVRRYEPMRVRIQPPSPWLPLDWFSSFRTGVPRAVWTAASA
jgi:hypothetical protein